MRNSMNFVVAAVLLISAVAAPAQSRSCNQKTLEGVWCATCTGFTDLSKLFPGTPPGTLVPLSMISRGEISLSGSGTREGFASVAGTVGAFEMEETFKINPDCSGEKTYTMKIPDLKLTLPGKATFFFTPGDSGFQMMILNQGDVITCEYRKMFSSAAF